MTSEVETAPEEGVRKPAPRRSRGVWTFVRDIILIFLAALLVSFLIKTFLIRSFYIPSGSMENTLQLNDRIIVNLLSPGVMPLKNGDVIVFKDPGGWLDNEPAPAPSSPVASGINNVLGFVGLTAPDSNDHLVKRVIGLPGDHVKCCNALGQLTVNGVPLKEPYIKLPPGVTKADPVDFDVTVPKGKLWVMGDNRDASADSAFHYSQHSSDYFVPVSDVVGRAFVVSWPVSHWSTLSNYPLTFAGVAKAQK
jgi:signal peptidase I